MGKMKSNLIYIKKPELFKELELFQDKFWAVADIKIKSHLPQWVQDSERVYWIHRPEEEKTLASFEKIVHFFLEKGISRTSTLIAIGGGATTDLAGLVAATILRGIDWVAVPTTLLAMVDASIGGKVGINMPQGKNLLGAFHLPHKVYLCQDFLETLPVNEIQSGKGEILKYGFLSSKIYELILKKSSLDQIIFECAKYKEELVEKDFKEQGDRILLNLGHTLGHAFESSFKISHGLAVAMGIKYLFVLFDEKQRLAEWDKLATNLELPLESLKLTEYSSFNLETFKNFIGQDKKKTENVIRLVLVDRIGLAYTLKMNLNEFIEKIEEHDVFKN